MLFGLVGVGACALLYPVKLAERALSNPENETAAVRDAARIVDPHLPNTPYNILVIGSDRRPGKLGAGDTGRSDTLLLARLDFKRGFISMLSFPRDLYVNIPGHGRNKINAAYALGSNKLAVETIKQLTGEPINYFFNVDFQAFVLLVNDANGVYLDVDRWYFNDNAGRGAGQTFARINIKPGYQKLHGSDALAYVRYRHTDTDFARIARQQQFLSELKRQSRSVSGLDNIIDAVHSHVTTNMQSAGRLKDFLEFGLTIEKDRIARTQVPGAGATVNGASVVIPTQGQILDAVDRWKNPDFASQSPTKATDPAKVTVSVYNGTHRLRLGMSTTEALAARGYDAAFAGNAPDGFYQSTSLFYAPGERDAAKALQPLFGDSASIVARRAGQPTNADVLVMVGSDYQGLITPRVEKPPKVRPDVVATTSLRRLIRDERGATGMNLLVPTHVVRGSRVVYVRRYNVDHGDRGKPDTITIVFKLARNSTYGGNSYYSITQTSMRNPPIVKTRTGIDRQGNSTFYDGRNMQRLLWQRGDMTYWISNSLDEALSVETIRDIRQWMLAPKKTTLPRGQTDTPIAIQENARTP